MVKLFLSLLPNNKERLRSYTRVGLRVKKRRRRPVS